MRGVVVDLAVNFLNGDSTGTFICLKVALTLLWATSVLSTAAPAARVVPAKIRAMALRVNFMVSPSKGTAGQHAAHGAVAVDDSVFQGGRHVQGDDGGHGHVEPVVHDLQDLGEVGVLADQHRQVNFRNTRPDSRSPAYRNSPTAAPRT
jgi:hypothetical protein